MGLELMTTGLQSQRLSNWAMKALLSHEKIIKIELKQLR